MQRRSRWLVAGLAAGVVVMVAGGLGAGPAVSQSADDEELTDPARERAVAAALDATGGGTVTETETGDDGAAYGVEIRLPDGRDVEVNLDRDFKVIGQEADDDSDGEADTDD